MKKEEQMTEEQFTQQTPEEQKQFILDSFNKIDLASIDNETFNMYYYYAAQAQQELDAEVGEGKTKVIQNGQVTKEFLSHALDCFDAQQKLFTEKEYTLFEGKSAHKQMKFTIDFLKKMAVWEGTYWFGMLKIIDMLEESLPKAKEDKDFAFTIDLGGLVTIHTLLVNLKGGYKEAKWFKSKEKVYAEVQNLVIDKVNEGKEIEENLKIHQTRIGLAINGIAVLVGDETVEGLNLEIVDREPVLEEKNEDAKEECTDECCDECDSEKA